MVVSCDDYETVPPDNIFALGIFFGLVVQIKFSNHLCYRQAN